MITNITISNFRAFQSSVRIRLRPITVLIGKNSAGKSSLIKFLLMLRQTLESQSDQFFVTDGKLVRLGTWLDLRHSNTRQGKAFNSYFRYRIGIETSDLPPPEFHAMWQAVSGSQPIIAEGGKFRLNLEFPREAQKKELPKANFTIGHRVYYGRQFKYGVHEVIGGWDNVKNRFHKRTVNNLHRVGFLRFAERTDSLNKMLEGVTAEPFLDTLRHEFLTIRHLSPVREESQRVVQTGSSPPGDVGQKGEFTMPHLVEILKNTAMHEQSALIKKYAKLVAGVDNLDSQRRFAKMLTEIVAQNPDTKAKCLLADFGFGVSQCLPIFVQGALHHRNQLLMVEQPEAQLHPTAQLELGSFFAELWNGRGVPSLIETHSPNILLRLRKLISKGQLSPADVSVAFFTVGKRSRPSMEMIDDLFGDEEGMPGRFPAVVVKNLNINPDGSLGSKEDGLPMEFFGADIKEALDFGEAKND
jgi:ABC-type ATPase involved in cell division